MYRYLILDSGVADAHNGARTGISQSRGSSLRAWAGGLMADLFKDPVAEMVLWAALAAIAAAVAIYVIGRIRAEPSQQEPTASELISKFRELHSRGELSDAEFRTIKTTLAVRLDEELKDNGETG